MRPDWNTPRDLFHGWLSLAAALALAPLCGAAESAARPNILLILADNWSWPHASALGDATVRTPAFDRVAREGTLFNRAFCPVPSCSPTRSCLLTGRAAHQLGEAASLWSAFPARHRVFTMMLRDAGFEIGFEGKGWSPGNFKDSGWTENPAGRQFKNFAEFLRSRDAGKPFFYWLGSVATALHKWQQENPDAHAGLDPASVKVPPCLPDTPEVRENILAYYGSVRRLDAQAADAIAQLEHAGLLDNTLVIYTSDNGWQMPRGLANCYDTGCHVPMAVRWPAHTPAGRSVDDFVCLTDLAPTFLEVAGLKREPQMTGVSFLDLISGKPPATPRDSVYLERERHANVRRGNLSYPIRGIRTKDFLYLWNLRPDRWPAGDPEVYMSVGAYGDVDGTRVKSFMLEHAGEPPMRRFFDLSFAKRPAEELYDLRRDPDQLENVAGRADYAKARAELRARVEGWMKETNDPRTGPACDVWDTYPYFGGTAPELRAKTVK